MSWQPHHVVWIMIWSTPNRKCFVWVRCVTVLCRRDSIVVIAHHSLELRPCWGIYCLCETITQQLIIWFSLLISYAPNWIKSNNKMANHENTALVIIQEVSAKQKSVQAATFLCNILICWPSAALACDLKHQINIFTVNMGWTFTYKQTKIPKMIRTLETELKQWPSL